MNFLFGLIIGVTVGFFVAALLVAARTSQEFTYPSDDEIQDAILRIDVLAMDHGLPPSRMKEAIQIIRALCKGAPS